MTVKQLIKLLKAENQNAEIFAYLGAEQGWKIQPLGRGDAIIGKGRTDSGQFVMLPVEVPDSFEPWDDSEPDHCQACEDGTCEELGGKH